MHYDDLASLSFTEAAPMAAAALAQAKLVPRTKSIMTDLLAVLQPLTKSVRDEILHRNLVAAMAISTEPTVTALIPSAPGGEVIYGKGVAGTETSIDVVHPGPGGIAAMARNIVSGYVPASMPLTPDQPTQSGESAAPLSSFLVAFEDLATDLDALLQTLDLPEHSAERKAKNKLLAQAAGLLQPVVELEAAPGRGWMTPDPGPIPIRSKFARVRSTSNDPATLAVHDGAGQVVAAAVAAPLTTPAVVAAQQVGQPTTYVVSGVATANGKTRQTAPVEEELVWVPFPGVLQRRLIGKP